MRWVCTRTFAASAGAAAVDARAAKSATSVRPASAIPPKADLFPAIRPRFPGSVAGPEIRTCDAQMTIRRVNRRLSRRDLLAAGAATGAALALDPQLALAEARERTVARVDFSEAGDGRGWDGWHTVDVANLLRADGQGLLEAGSDVFPND